MLDVDSNFFSPLDLKQDQVIQGFQFDPPVTATLLTETHFFKAFTRPNPHCEILYKTPQITFDLRGKPLTGFINEPPNNS